MPQSFWRCALYATMFMLSCTSQLLEAAAFFPVPSCLHACIEYSARNTVSCLPVGDYFWRASSLDADTHRLVKSLPLTHFVTPCSSFVDTSASVINFNPTTLLTLQPSHPSSPTREGKRASLEVRRSMQSWPDLDRSTRFSCLRPGDDTEFVLQHIRTGRCRNDRRSVMQYQRDTSSLGCIMETR